MSYELNRTKFSTLVADAWRIQQEVHLTRPVDTERRDLASKYFCLMVQNALVLEQMFGFPRYKPELTGEEPVEFCPYAPACVLTRSLIETYLAFFHLFVDPVPKEHLVFRLQYWKAMGRRPHLQALQMGGRGDTHRRELAAADERAIADVMKSPLFKSYKRFKAGRVGKLESDYAHSLKQMARAAGFPKEFFETVYADLSSHVHANSFAFSFYSIFDPGNEDALRLLERVLRYAMIFLGFGMREYCTLEKQYAPCFSDEAREIVEECVQTLQKPEFTKS